MNLTRIADVIDTSKTQAATVTVVGAGGAADLIVALARCGVGGFIDCQVSNAVSSAIGLWLSPEG